MRGGARGLKPPAANGSLPATVGFRAGPLERHEEGRSHCVQRFLVDVREWERMGGSFT